MQESRDTIEFSGGAASRIRREGREGQGRFRNRIRGTAVLFMFMACLGVNAQLPQQGSKLVAGDASGAAFQGFSVSVSQDGNTAAVGGPTDNGSVGAVWIYTRTNNAWTEQAKLVGSNASGTPEEGYSVALSGDGNTVIFG